MLDRRTHLKVKIKSLAAEAKIIRAEERKGGVMVNSLHFHRVCDVRREARHSQLAYAFIRGVPYKVVEPNSKNAPNWSYVAKLVEKFGIVYHPARLFVSYDQLVKLQKEQSERFLRWKEEALSSRSVQTS